MKKLLTLALAALMCFSLAACGGDSSSEGQTGGTYIIAETLEPSSMNPDAVSDDGFYSIAQNMYPRLYKLNNNYEAIPDLASKYECSDDALTYTFTLRENAVWTDGEAVTADDVVYTYNTIIENSYANASVFVNVESITATDDYTVVIKMTQPDASFMSNVSWYGTFILPQHIFDINNGADGSDDWISNPYTTGEEAPVTCGPFKFSAWNKGTDVRLVRDDNYWGDTAYLDELVYTIVPDDSTAYQAWLNGEVDEISSSSVPTSELQSLIDSGDYTVVEQLWPSPYYVTFNMNEGPFSNVLVREAFAYGVDRDIVSEKAFNGLKPANDHFISDLYTDAHNEDAAQPEVDYEKAMELLEKAGYKKNADGYYFETTLTIFEGFEDPAYVVISELEKIGIKATLNSIDYNVWQEQVWNNQQFDFTMVAGFQGPDVLGSLRRWTKDGTVNVNGYSRAEIEELATKCLNASSTEEINGYMKEIQTYLREDLPLVTMVSYVDHSVFNKNIHGHPMFSNEQGGSRDKAGFSEMTYVWLD